MTIDPWWDRELEAIVAKSGAVRGATLAEVIFGIVIFLLFVLFVVGVLGQAADLSRRDGEINQVNMLAQDAMERMIEQGRTQPAFDNLANVPLSPCQDPNYMYRCDVAQVVPGLKKITVTVFYAKAGAVDTSRANAGRALILATQVEAP